MKYFIFIGLLLVSVTICHAEPLAEFQKAYKAKKYDRAFEILIALRTVAENPKTFHKMMGVVAYQKGAYLYAMMLLEEYYQKVNKSPEALGNFVVAASQVWLDHYAIQAFYDDILNNVSMPDHVKAVIAPELVLEALSKGQVEAAGSFLPALKNTRKGLLIGGIFAHLNNNYEVAKGYFAALMQQDIRHTRDYDLYLLAHLNMARTYYEQEDFQKSTYHYNRIPRSSRLKAQAVIESGWAYFRNGELNLALGRAESFISPYFLQRIYPDPLLQRSMILLELCKYSEMAYTLGVVYKAFKPMIKQLSTLVNKGPSGVPEDLIEDRKSKLFSKLPKPLALHLLEHEKTRQIRSRLNAIEENVDVSLSMARQSRFFGKDVANLKRYIGHLTQFALDAYRKWVQSEIQEVLSHIQRKVEEADLMKIEATIGEQEALENIELIIKKSLDAESVFSITTENHELWRFNSEWWNDELFYYEINTPTSCISDPQNAI